MNAAAASLVPSRINTGPFVTAYSHAELKARTGDARFVLPVCSLGTPTEQLAALGPWVLPPLYHEALIDGLQAEIVARIRRCFPYFEGSRARAEWKGRLDVVELPRTPPPRQTRPAVFAFSIDTGVEQHGPHLPLATDTIQSYAVLERLAAEIDGFVVGAPVDYGQLTWGLPFGFSIDLTAPLVMRYVTGFVNAVMEWLEPAAIYVADVHGSAVHWKAIQDGLAASRCPRHAFRWLYDPLVGFGPARGDVHAGGVETAVVHAVSTELVDASWWPGRIEQLAAGQMTAKAAIDLSADVPAFVQYVEARPLNGIVGSVHNFFDLDGPAMLERMHRTAQADVRALMSAAKS